MSAVERKYYLQWQRPTENEVFARLRRRNKKPEPVLLDRVNIEIDRLLKEVRGGEITNRDFWIRRSRILKKRDCKTYLKVE